MPEFEYIPELNATVNWGEFRRALEHFDREHPLDIATIRAVEERLTPDEKLLSLLPECNQAKLDAEVA